MSYDKKLPQTTSCRIGRRDFLRASARNLLASSFCLTGSLALPLSVLAAEKPGNPAKPNTTGPTSTTNQLKKVIPSSGEAIPVVGMGTWITFNVGESTKLRANCLNVLREFFKHGGGMIDSSPMYGSAESVVGYCLKKLNYPKELFAATKVWTSSDSEGKEQFQNSYQLWGVELMHLQQVHNLVNWQSHLKMLREQKAAGKIKYIGITTSHGRRHEDVAAIMQKEPLDFVQLTYNIDNRAVEKNLLPIAKDRGIAVICNRPFGGGAVIDRYKRQKLPGLAKELGITTWADYLLKFLVSHPAVTCAIPATSKVAHMQENMQASRGSLPDQAMRKKMIQALPN